MDLRRYAPAALATALVLTTSACRFSRSANELPPTSTTLSTVALIDDTTTSVEETTTTITGSPSTTRRVATTVRASSVTTRPVARTATTARVAPATPHCNVSAGDTFYGGSWTASVTSTFPNATVVVDLSWSGGSGNYSGVTDGGGSYTKTQRVQPSMRGQTVQVKASVGGRTCSTSFKVS